MLSRHKRRWLGLGILGIAIFYALGGWQFTQAVNLSYADSLQPIPAIAGTRYTHAASFVFQTTGQTCWWTRTSVRTDEAFRFYLWDPIQGWVGPVQSQAYRAAEFGDKAFFRKAFHFTHTQPRLRQQIKLEILTTRQAAEFRVALLEYPRWLNILQSADLIVLGIRLGLTAFLLWGLWLFGKNAVFSKRYPWLQWRTPLTLAPVLMLVIWLTVVIRLGLAALVYGSTSDILFWITWAEVAHQQLDVYAAPVGFDKTPLLLWLCSSARWLSDTLGYSFTFTIRIWMMLADALIAGILVAAGFRMTGNAKTSGLLGLAYSFNPLILGVFLHGQMDSVSIAGLVCAWAGMTLCPGWWGVGLAGLGLGLGAAVKFYVIILAPFLFFKWRRWDWRIGFFAMASLVWLIPIVLYGKSQAALQAVAAYTGGGPGGWSLSLFPNVLVAFNQVLLKIPHAPFWQGGEACLQWFAWQLGPFSLSLWLLLLGWAAIYCWVLPAVSLAEAWLWLCLTYFVLGQNVAPQYLSWPIALGIIAALEQPARRRYFFWFGVIAGTWFWLGLAVDRNLLYPVLHIRLDIPWTLSWLVMTGLRIPIWLFCGCWWFWEIHNRKPGAWRLMHS